jgi:tetratricopeptide (TPR) repeat protein
MSDASGLQTGDSILALFSKKSGGSDDGGDGNDGNVQEVARDPRKARPWFERATTVAETRNFDYAVQCYIQGLQHSPESMGEHEALREVAMKRKVGGGKPAGWRDKSPVRGKTHVEKMLEAEYLFSMDPTAADQALKMMEEAVAATEAGEADLTEVAYWVGDLVIEANRNSKKPVKSTYIKARDLFAGIQAYNKAVEACAAAVQLDSENAVLIRELRNLQAEATIHQSKLAEEGDFKKSIKDVDKQQALADDDSIAASGDKLDQQIARLRKEYEDSPDDVARLGKLIRALLQKEDNASENDAVALLESTWESSGQYRFKMQIGDIRMKQFNRALREMRKELQADPSNSEVKEKMRRAALAQVKFELKEYQERVKNYPTDMGLRFQLGRRHLSLHNYDDAIAAFQEAQSDPKHRGAALRYLGEAFAAKEWFDEAIDTFRRGIDSHERNDDKLALELRYDLMDALDRKARKEEAMDVAREASDIASEIAQRDINFKDIRKRIDGLRAFIDELKSKQQTG